MSGLLILHYRLPEDAVTKVPTEEFGRVEINLATQKLGELMLHRKERQAGDVAVGISTSGNSPNVLSGIRQAKRQGLRTVALTGSGGGALAGEAELAVVVPSSSTPRIQEAHITIGHTICALVEDRLTTA